mmetsp:Transcript_36426/g.89702  ORF Transcript_36426/g.89702 Transcript_36426/m.89702 type:complete len:158 (+) Transcript_36426:152-625(+)
MSWTGGSPIPAASAPRSILKCPSTRGLSDKELFVQAHAETVYYSPEDTPMSCFPGSPSVHVQIECPPASAERPPSIEPGGWPQRRLELDFDDDGDAHFDLAGMTAGIHEVGGLAPSTRKMLQQPRTLPDVMAHDYGAVMGHVEQPLIMQHAEKSIWA